MNRDDPLALLGALDPADERSVQAIVARLDDAGFVDRALTPATHRPARLRRPVVAWLALSATAVVVLLAALLANPFAGTSEVGAAQAKAQAAAALVLSGDWHVTRVTQSGTAKGTRAPAFSPPLSDDLWHAADGRFAITTSQVDRPGSALKDTSTTLYANGERRIYDGAQNTLRVHRFILPADLRDDERAHVPSSAADLYRAAYRVGKVRLAGRETIAGRQVYRLVFEWLGASYTLVFDADRRVPISSEARTPLGGDRFWVTRVRYLAYAPVTASDVQPHLRLPPVPAGATRTPDGPIVIATPREGAPASDLARAIEARYAHSFVATAAPGSATYSVVDRIPGGGVAALAHIPDRGTSTCYASAEIAHPGGEAWLGGAGCFSRAGGAFSAKSQSGMAMLIGGAARGASVTLKFSNGRAIHAPVRGGLYLVAVPIGLFRFSYAIVSRNPDGTNHYETALPQTFPPGISP